MKAIKIGKNKQGEKIAVIPASNGDGYTVIIQKSNYEQGKIRSAWKTIRLTPRMGNTEFQDYAKNGVALEVAIKLFNKRVVEA